ncbi:hypothetical protein K0M31_018356 [Melipona bicolor]|uniref:Uncharacterized protein n=1 Tax=Melipona bicolor TaxID=60889 RepID=A0AA40G371_9HYME|nr:hypothetical protein K0M31_018356 [Melipona bicolor]
MKSRRNGGRDPRGSEKERGQGGAWERRAVGVEVEAEAEGKDPERRKRALKRSKRSEGLKKKKGIPKEGNREKDGLAWDQRWSETMIQEGYGGGGDEIGPWRESRKKTKGKLMAGGQREVTKRYLRIERTLIFRTNVFRLSLESYEGDREERILAIL